MLGAGELGAVSCDGLAARPVASSHRGPRAAARAGATSAFSMTLSIRPSEAEPLFNRALCSASLETAAVVDLHSPAKAIVLV
jgi:hypothetical protein